MEKKQRKENKMTLVKTKNPDVTIGAQIIYYLFFSFYRNDLYIGS